MTNSGCVEALVDVLLDRGASDVVISEVTAALAVLADEGMCLRVVLELTTLCKSQVLF